MDFSDEQWTQIRDVAEEKAMKLTYGDKALSEDLASLVIEKLLVKDHDVQLENLNAYVRTMVRNAYLDRKAKQNAAYRGGPSLKHPMDEEIHAIADEVAGVFKYSLLTSSPSNRLVRRERQDMRAHAYQEILASLPDKQQRMVRMAAEGLSHKEIADALGYKSAAVVKQTLHRTYRKVRERFDLRYSDFFT